MLHPQAQGQSGANHEKRLERNCLQKHCGEQIYSLVVPLEYISQKLLVYIVSSKLPTQFLI